MVNRASLVGVLRIGAALAFAFSSAGCAFDAAEESATSEWDEAASPASAKCGNGSCDYSESCSSCAKDCGVCPFCGDGVCDGWESCSQCASDCGCCEGDTGCEAGCPADKVACVVCKSDVLVSTSCYPFCTLPVTYCDPEEPAACMTTCQDACPSQKLAAPACISQSPAQ